MDPRRWRCGDRCATGRRFAARGQEQGHPVDSPGGCPPAAPTPAHRLPGLPHISTAGGLAAAIGATTLIFFQPLLRANALRASLANPFHCRTGAGGGAARRAGEPRRGAPGGSKGRPKGRTGGRHAPAPWGARLPPSGGLLEGEGEPPGGRGNPAGVPRERSENSPKTDQKCCIEES